jgi:hypothetical protein
MKTTKLDKSGMFEPLTVRSNEIEFTLPPEAVNVRSNGVEFLANQELPVWSELTIDLKSPRNNETIHCNGIVVGSSGSRHSGFVISILFVGLDPEAQSQLESLARVHCMSQ